MKKYWRLYLLFFRVNLMKRMAYRLNFILGALLVMAESLTIIFGVTIIYGHIDSIAGWSLSDMYVLSGIFMITNSLAWLLYKGGVTDLDKHINSGTLDWHLIRPVDAQFILSTQRIDIEDGARSIIGLFLMGYGLRESELFSTLIHIPVFIFLMICSTLILYSITLSLKTISFTSIQGWATNSIFWRFHDLARFPTDIYTGGFRILYTFILPLAFVATVPAKSLTGKLSLQLIFGALVATVVSVVLSRFIWKRALLGYSSASS
ncbi:MAG: hypothetical protein GW939_01255 [Candidatus Magasanikbacteria bacterium]|uniref:ABC transporter permease n=1 Tax=Candidatus Magasanikbacteria bacterium CG10_big_fil_rev_8_21_14_0_10_38_6 TaxID=1974647 RepID=A0A2M6NZH4_9BACT|nr:hypothetical protein [Candidatus Magasanikbacteria bacterium]NCS72173.1 hypothetical protein [Candidatus Magasanikbacteria bacterium]PIR76847.1 MAG: hypothetical protein COU30_05665 [Candidatus Magasanikbacteria bacterium CG10_big_fil_rev_8_21_14_0_10_38_6]